jgi:hypothetical protein
VSNKEIGKIIQRKIKMISEILTTIPSTDPTNMLRLRDSVYSTDLLITAVAHFEFFSLLDKNPVGIAEISLEIEQRPADVMLTLFKALDLIGKFVQESKSGR